MREGRRARMNLNLRTSVVSLNRRADGAMCRDISSLPRALGLSTSLSLFNGSHPPFTISSHSTDDDITWSGNN